MLKKITILILTCMFAMTALSGCSIIAEQNEKSLIENALKERYSEEFVCMRTWNNAAGGYYDDSFYGLCHPKDDESLLFEILLNGDGSIRGDDYGSTIISRRFVDIFDEQIGTKLGKHYTYCYNYGDLNDDVTGQMIANDEFTFEYYFNALSKTYTADNVLGLYFTICIDVSEQPSITYEEEYDLIVSTLEHIYAIGEKYGMNLTLELDLYYVSSDIYTVYTQYIIDNARLTTSFHHLLNDDIKHQQNQFIELDMKNHQLVLTAENYIALRKENN